MRAINTWCFFSPQSRYHFYIDKTWFSLLEVKIIRYWSTCRLWTNYTSYKNGIDSVYENEWILWRWKSCVTRNVNVVNEENWVVMWVQDYKVERNMAYFPNKLSQFMYFRSNWPKYEYAIIRKKMFKITFFHTYTNRCWKAGAVGGSNQATLHL